MKYRVIVSVVITVAWASAAFSQAAPPAPAPAPVEEPPPVLTVPKDYKYDARGRRDPFINPVPKPVAAAAPAEKPAIPAVRPPGLKGVLVAEAAIAGVVTSKEPSMNVVIINAPAGRTYFARIGDELFDAVVKEIRLDTVTFALNSPGSGAESTPREIVRKVRPTAGE
jgi:hypothetical protein